MISYIVPTRDRPQALALTLDALGRLSAPDHERAGGAEVVVVDNASKQRPLVPPELANGMAVRLLTRPSNEAAAARNTAAEHARGEWLVMLDDDSRPLDTGLVDVLLEAPPDVAAIGADITLPGGRREAGGLPEVFVGCGVAIRRQAFLEAGGYDPAFHYYAEEYDLAARFLLRGWRIAHDLRFRVRHEKLASGRDMDLILSRLVRNNGWVAQRYAPDSSRDESLRELIGRYAAVSVKERAATGFARGLDELFSTLHEQPRREMDEPLFERFTGVSHVRRRLACEPWLGSGARVAIVDEGKNAWAVRRVLEESGAALVDEESEAEVVVIGTLSPGPMLDAWERRAALGQRVLRPWCPEGAAAAAPC